MRRDEIDETNPFAAPESDLTPEATEATVGRLEYASFWARLGAMIVDNIISQIIVYAVIIPVAFGLVAADADNLTLMFGNQILAIVISWLYFALQESSATKAMIGKRLLDLKVVDLNGQKISFGGATGRYFGRMLSGILVIGYLMQPFTQKKQALHDIMAGTLGD